KAKTFPEPRHLGFLGTQGEADVVEKLLYQSVCLLDLGLRLAQDHEVVGITHEAKAGVVELPVETVQSDVGQQGGEHPSNQLAKWPRWGSQQKGTDSPGTGPAGSGGDFSRTDGC